jgi:hypothetical protein
MSKDTDNSLFIVSSMPRLYQQLMTSIGTYEELGTRIVRQIKQYHSFRRLDEIRELGRILINFPIKEYRLIGQYYLLWCGCREKKYHAYILENVIEQSRTYKTRALQSRAAIEVYQGNLTEAMHFYSESFKTQPSTSEYTETTKAIAFIKSVEGFHDSALKDLESLIPILRYAEPFAYYDILNSYAVELGETGRKDEARNISRIVVASPFAYAYPEWQATADDLKEPNRSFVAISSSPFTPQNVLAMPAIEHGEIRESSYNQPARVLDLQKWKKKMAKGKKGKKDNGDDIENVDEMDDKDLLATLIHIAAQDDMDEEILRQIVKYAIKVTSEPYKPEPDDTDGA